MVFSVVVSAGSTRTCIRGLLGDSLKVSVRAVPERGRANAEMTALLAELLGVPVARISIQAGQSCRRKQVRIAGLQAKDLLARLGGAGGGK